MSKGLEAIISLRNRLVEKGIKDQFLEELIAIEKSLKALEIIKGKRVDIGWLIRSKNCSKYNLGVGTNQHLKNTEYDLLKEVLL